MVTLPIDPIEELLALQAIYRLQARYFRGIDLKRWDEWHDVFTEDCEFFISDEDWAKLEREHHPVTQDPLAGAKVIRGREPFVALVQKIDRGAVSVHQGFMPDIEVLTASTARGTWSMSDYLEWPPIDGERQGLRGYGYYEEEYRKCDDGQWRIASWRLSRLRIDQL
jgi:hypothetical protein